MDIKRNATIGIDLGTRNALCAAMDGGRPVVVPNRWGRASTPSVVGWEAGWVVGEDAVRLSLRTFSPVWWDLKRKVGGDFRAFCGGKSYKAENLLVPLLAVLREDAEAFLGQFVSSCVLAVPAGFSLLQRKAMTQAAEDAGLREVRIVAEPTAAALAFGREGRFLILDFGAGTVDVSVVESENGVWQVLESVGSAKIGGYDFDLALAEWLRERLGFGALPASDPRWRTLVLEAETIKIALSSSRSFDWTPPALGKGIFLNRNSTPILRVEREDLERMVRFSIRRIVHVVQRMWERYKPEHLLFVGGASRMPLLREILEKEVARPERLSLCPEESIAAGAALYTRGGKKRLLLDVLSGDIGLLRDGAPEILIPAGTPVPFTARTTFVPSRSGRMEVPVFQRLADMRGSAVKVDAIRGNAQEERTILSRLELEVTEDLEVELRCTLSAAGAISFGVKHKNALAEVPLSPKDESVEAAPRFSNRQRIRALKLRLTPLEILLSPSHVDRLYSLVRRIEDVEDEESSVEILETVVKGLEVALS
jgi:molecular chaperone DnaK (HSP70)